MLNDTYIYLQAPFLSTKHHYLPGKIQSLVHTSTKLQFSG